MAVVMLLPTACTGPEPTATATPARPSATAVTPEELLNRLRPEVVLDGKEEFPPVAVEAFVQHPDAKLYREGSGAVIASRKGAGESVLTPGYLGAKRYADGQPVQGGDTISVTAGYDGWHERAEDQNGYEGVVYGRVVKGGDGRTYLQYRLFHVFNDSLPDLSDVIGGFAGRLQHDHEADWEMIQIGLDDRQRPITVVLSQHKGWLGLEWSQVEHRRGRPVFYLARGTHAVLPKAGCTHTAFSPVEDCNDAGHAPLRVRLVPLDRQSWHAWPGWLGTAAAPVTRPDWWEPELLERSAIWE
jgi:hypothetical protein